MQKRSIYLIIIVVLILAILGYFYTFEKEIKKSPSLEISSKEREEIKNIFPYSKVQEPTTKLRSSSIQPAKEKIDYRGYIITLKNEPSTKIYQKEKSSADIQQKISEQETRIIAEQTALKQNLKNLRANIKIISENKKVSNSIVVSDLTPSEIVNLKKEGYKITPNYKVQATLMDSVPLINANDVWKLNKNLKPCLSPVPANQDVTRVRESKTVTADAVAPLEESQQASQIYFGGTCLTGVGTKIGIIDTGIDYTHPDLGATQIEERPFTKVNDEELNLFYDSRGLVDQQLSIDQNRIAYYSGNKIKIYSFDTQETTTYDPYSLDLAILRIYLKDNYIVYFATDQATLEDTSVYILNLNTSTNQKISTDLTADIGYLGITDNEKIVYSKAPTDSYPSDYFSNIYVYDIPTQTTTKLVDDVDFMYLPKVSGNKVAYSAPAYYCYDHLEIYDLSLGASNSYYLPEFGPVLAFHGNEVLYAACNATDFDPKWKTYYIYNIDSGESTKLKYLDPWGGNATEWGWLSTFSYIAKAAFGENLIFFSKDINANRIIAYDRIQERYVLINLITESGTLDASGNKVCFLSSDNNIYCHDYDPYSNYSLPEHIFNNKVIGGYDFVNNDIDPYDDHGHGTHCAATAAGNGILKGVAPGAKIVSYKVLDSRGSGWWDDVIAAIERSVDPNQDGNFSDHLDVISLSLGGWGHPDDEVSLAIDNAVDLGVVATISAGNSGPEYGTIGSPGTSRKAITVGASDKYDLMAWFSSRGHVVWENSTGQRDILIKPDVVAPGVDICAAQWDSAWYWYECHDDKHVAISGTSMAAPHVAGLAAILKQKNPSWNPEQIKNTIKASALDINEITKSQGHGRIDALQAVYVSSPPEVWDFGIIPPEEPLLNAYDIIEIEGIFPQEYDSLIVEYANETNPGEWHTEGITPIGQGRLVATFNPINIPASGLYYFRATMTKNSETKKDMLMLYFDISLPGSWKEVNDKILPSLNIADIDNDQQKELIAHSKDGYVYAWNSDGSAVNGWPAYTGEPDQYCLRLIHQSSSSPAIEDLDNDGDTEVIVGSLNGNVYVFESDGSVKPGWPKTVYAQCISSTPAIKDINNDGFKEIVLVGTSDIFVFDYQGNNLPGFPLYKSGTGGPDFSSSPSVADIDKDNFYDILLGRSEWWNNGHYTLEAIDHIGEDVDGWPFVLPDYIYSTPAIGDVDNDGNKEVAFCDRDWNLYLVGSNGEIKPGWPSPAGCIDGDPSLADLNNDGQLEIMVGGMSFNEDIYMTHVKDPQGNNLPGWPQIVNRTTGGAFGKGMLGPIVGNVDADPENEIISTTEFPDFAMFVDGMEAPKVYAWNYDGSAVNGWPRSIYPTKSMPIIEDFNDDGYDEVILGSGKKIYILPTNGTNEANQWPIFKHDTQHTGCYDCEENNNTNCTESWQCGPWSECINGTQTRNCVDINNCGTIYNRPPTSQSCGVINSTDAFNLYYNETLGVSLTNNGDVYLRMYCRQNSTCEPPNGDSYIIYNTNNEPVAFITDQGKMCIEGYGCSNQQASCNATTNDFIIQDTNGQPKVVISNSGELCYTGNMIIG